MAKRLLAIAGTLAVLLVAAAVPALAQEPRETGDAVEATGVLRYAGSNGGYDYYSVIDEATETDYTLRSDSVDLGRYLDERVDISGTLVVETLGTETDEGEVEAESIYVEVDRVEPAGSPDPRIAVTFELTVEGEPPEDALFVGLLGGEPYPNELTDPDGDGVYTHTEVLTPVQGGPGSPTRIV